jgi:hypothetical protein
MTVRMSTVSLALAAALAWPAAGLAQQASDQLAPEAATGIAEGRLATATTRMVTAANPIAAEAGLEILRAGGSAADALVTVQTVLGLVEPQSSGIGGGAFILWYDTQTGEITTFDARETAPAAASGDLFLDDDGEPLAFFDAVVGGRSVGVPGVPRLMEMLHERHGRLGWEEVLAPAIALAEEGLDISSRLHGLLAQEIGPLDRQDAAAADFFGEDTHSVKQVRDLADYASGCIPVISCRPLVKLLAVAGTDTELTIPADQAATFADQLATVANHRFTRPKPAKAARLLSEAAARAADAGEPWRWTIESAQAA